jgi:hypothetical protein
MGVSSYVDVLEIIQDPSGHSFLKLARSWIAVIRGQCVVLEMEKNKGEN